mmetsp:Transcript_2767/g.8634  ORF Transcript_2767/g.8634 Transcript_2767/m.8634 type:complete len:214 (+) Transcript_2767:130-771(+)
MSQSVPRHPLVRRPRGRPRGRGRALSARLARPHRAGQQLGHLTRGRLAAYPAADREVLLAAAALEPPVEDAPPVLARHAQRAEDGVHEGSPRVEEPEVVDLGETLRKGQPLGAAAHAHHSGAGLAVLQQRVDQHDGGALRDRRLGQCLERRHNRSADHRLRREDEEHVVVRRHLLPSDGAEPDEGVGGTGSEQALVGLALSCLRLHDAVSPTE